MDTRRSILQQTIRRVRDATGSDLAYVQTQLDISPPELVHSAWSVLHRYCIEHFPHDARVVEIFNEGYREFHRACLQRSWQASRS